MGGSLYRTYLIGLVYGYNRLRNTFVYMDRIMHVLYGFDNYQSLRNPKLG